jgi:hypothetical protein
MQAAAFGLSLLYALALFQAAPPQPVSPATFVGTWVGLQTVARNTSPGVVEGQTVTMTIDLVDGRLTGTLAPFFGGSDGASFVEYASSAKSSERRQSSGGRQRPAAEGRPPGRTTRESSSR